MLPKLDFGLELLYGANEQRGLPQDKTDPDDVQIWGHDQASFLSAATKLVSFEGALWRSFAVQAQTRYSVDMSRQAKVVQCGRRP